MIISKAAAERQQWLNGLNVGDEVAVDYGRRGGYHIGKITRITPTRRFTVEGKGCTFGNDGWEMVGKSRGSWGYCRSKIQPVTDEIKQAIVRAEAISYINAYLRVDNLSTQQLLDILKVIQQNE